MATIKIKIAREGYVAVAHRNAVPGLTSGGTIVYEVTDVPDSVNGDQLVKIMTGYEAPQTRFKLAFGELPVLA